MLPERRSAWSSDFRLGTLVTLCVALIMAGCGWSETYYIHKGNEFFTKGKLEDAALNYQKAARMAPNRAEAWYRLGLCRLKQGRGSDAYDALTQAVDKSPDFTAAKLALADVAFRIYSGDPARPAKFYKQLSTLLPELLKQNPRCFDCLRDRGYLQLFDRHPADALASFRAADQIRPMQDENVTGMVAALAQLKQTEEAEKLATALIQKDKSYGQIYDQLYALYQDQRRPTDAERIFQLKVANNPSVTVFRLQLAAYYYNNKQLSDFDATVRPFKEDHKTFPRGRIDLAEFFIRLQKWQEAQALLEESAGQDRVNRQLALDLELRTLVAQGKNDSAAQLGDRVLKEFPADRGAEFLRLTLMVDSGDRTRAGSALQRLEKIRAEHGNDALYWQAIGQAELLLGDPKKAEGNFRKAANVDSGFKPARVSLAEISLAQGNPSNALRFADEAIGIDPLDARPRQLRAAALMASNRLPQATQELNALVKAAPHFEDAQFQLALADLASKRYSEAEALFARLYRPGNPDLRALTGLVQVRVTQNQTARALDLLNEDLKRNSNPDGVRRLLAQTAMRAGKPEIALSEYAGIVRAKPGSAPDLYMMAQAQQASGDSEGAIASLRRAVTIKPDDVGALSALGFLLQQTSRDGEAVDVLRRVLKLRPNDANTLNNLAYSLAESGGSLDEALQLAERAVLAAPSQPAYADTLGVIYLKKKMAAEALQALQKATRNAPDNPAFLYHLGLAQINSGRPAAARASLTAALAKDPPAAMNAQIREALGRVNR